MLPTGSKRSTTRAASWHTGVSRLMLSAGPCVTCSGWLRCPTSPPQAIGGCLAMTRPVMALSERTAAIQSPAGSVTVYRRHNKPGLGPVGDSLDDLG